MIKGFTVESLKHKLLRKPIEDYFDFGIKSRNPDEADDNYGISVVLAVADGVTRDAPGVSINPKTTLKDCLINPINAYRVFKLAKNYPNPSPAARAATRFVERFMAIALSDWSMSAKKMKEVYRQCNERIQEFIPTANIDYLVNDLPACVASSAVFSPEGLVYGYIADCRIAIVDKNGNLRFVTADEGPRGIDKDIREKYGETFREPAGRKRTREQYRNNPAEPLAYGALTGEKNAIHYVKTGFEKIAFREDSVLVHTDGVTHILYKKDGDIQGNVADLIRKRDFDSLERLCQKEVKTEGTLVIANYPV